MAKERERLEAWLTEPGHRERVQEEPAAIAEFDALPADRGGPATQWLQWWPRRIEPAQKAGRWQTPLATLYTDVVPVYEPVDYLAGPKDDSPPFLVELVPINVHETSFSGA